MIEARSARVKLSATIGLELLFNFVLPYVIYVELAPGMGDVHALLASSLPPIAWSLIEFARHRKVDALSVIVLAGIVLSLLAFIGGGSARLLQLRENLVTGVVALVFLGSAAIGRPLIYQLARAGLQRRSPEQASQFEARRGSRAFKRVMTLMTLVWGFGLLVQTALACALVFTMPIADYLIVSPVLGYGFMGGLGLWTFWYGRRAKRRSGLA